ncbi:hypothetical protein NDU88_008792 [Pleurodeles waltl]|uniref:Uncharacterized protein n=1 Tax=Pleurodeles waltl TaxID=8319 RepID=A0AAV7PRE7_PLEWA|nr:hypothetical protein NDU88_008792 [Pleurodeles waltl]
MPRGKTTSKVTGKPTRQLLCSEALQQQKHPSVEDCPPLPYNSMTEDTQGVTMDCILQEISVVSRKLEGMDNAMVALTAETRSMRLDLAGFQSQMSGLDQRVTTRAQRLGPRRQDGNGRPRPIIACMLRHLQARQLLQTARTQGSFRSGNLEIRMSADFSKETANRRKAFLSSRTQLCCLEVKFGLFEPARMWITKNGESLNFYDPEELRTFLEGLQDQTQYMEMTTQPPRPRGAHSRVLAIRYPHLNQKCTPPQIPKAGEETLRDLRKATTIGAKYSKRW